jgi:hypothetical protein
MSFSTADQLSHKQPKRENSQNTGLTHPSLYLTGVSKELQPGST